MKRKFGRTSKSLKILWNVSKYYNCRFEFICKRFQCFITISFILDSVQLYLSSKGIFVTVSFFSSLRSCSFPCKSALWICYSINDLLYSRSWYWLINFVAWLKNFAVTTRFGLSVRLACRVCYLSAILGALIEHQSNFVGPFISYILLFVAYYFDLCRLKHLSIHFLLVSNWIQIWSKDVNSKFFVKIFAEAGAQIVSIGHSFIWNNVCNRMQSYSE